MYSRMIACLLVLFSLAACKNSSFTAENFGADSPGQDFKPLAVSVMPGCHTHLIVYQLHFEPSLNSDFPDVVPFDLPSAQNSLLQKSYNYLGEAAAKHSDNVVVIVTLAKDLATADVQFRQWSQDPNAPIFQVDGNVDIKKIDKIPLNATSVDQAVDQAIAAMPACSELQ